MSARPINDSAEWRTPHGLPDWVLVTADGRVHCAEHSRTRSDGRRQPIPANDPVRKTDIGGYTVVGFRIDGRMRTLKVHRLVLLAFGYKDGCEPLDVNHKSGVKSDNRLENLEWCTRSENHIHAYRVLGRRHAHKGKVAHNKGARYLECSVAVVAKKRNGEEMRFPSLRDAVLAGYTSSCISHCLAGRQHSHRGMRWSRA